MSSKEIKDEAQSDEKRENKNDKEEVCNGKESIKENDSFQSPERSQINAEPEPEPAVVFL